MTSCSCWLVDRTFCVGKKQTILITLSVLLFCMQVSGRRSTLSRYLSANTFPCECYRFDSILTHLNLVNRLPQRYFDQHHDTSASIPDLRYNISQPQMGIRSYERRQAIILALSSCESSGQAWSDLGDAREREWAGQ